MRKLYPMPLPKWIDLLKSIIHTNPSFSSRSEIWTFNSSYSIFSIATLRSKYSTKKINIFVPIFFCDQSLRLIRGNQLFKLIFYEINADLTANVESIYENSNKFHPDIILGVHFFGSMLDLTPLVEIAKKYSAWLIEDCVHIFSTDAIQKHYGDFIISSPHKHHAIPGGACIKVVFSGPSDFGFKTKNIEDELFRLSQPNSRKEKIQLTIFCIKWLVKRIVQKYIAVNALRNKKSKAVNSIEKFHHINVFIFNLLKISKNREVNLIKTKNNIHSTWLETLEAFLPYKNVRAIECNLAPYYSSFSSDDGVDKIFSELTEAKWPVVYWPDLPPEALQNREGENPAVNFKNRYIHLPNHFDITERQVFNCYKKYFSKVSKKWKIQELIESDWMTYFDTANSNYLQSWFYGEIKKSKSCFIKVKRLAVLNEDGMPVSIAQIIGIKIFFLPTFFQLNRGPILIQDHYANYSDLSLKIASIATIKKYLISNWSLLYRIHPEIKSSKLSTLGMKLLGYKRSNTAPWASGRLLLLNSENELFSGLSSKWRNSLRKGRSFKQVLIKHDPSSQAFEIFLDAYNNHKNEIGYAGISNIDIKAMARFHSINLSLNLFASYQEDDVDLLNPIGMLLSLGVGDTSTYLASTTTLIGRSMQTNTVLLWHAVCDAKNNGYKFFDIGGLNKTTTPGVSHFKRGLNSELYELSGVWNLF